MEPGVQKNTFNHGDFPITLFGGNAKMGKKYNKFLRDNRFYTLPRSNCFLAWLM